MSEQTPKTCAACGETFTHLGYGRYRDFHTRECRDAGRATCKFCGKDLPEDGRNRAFCNNLCRKRFTRKADIPPSLQEERARIICKACGKSITQADNKRRRKFCSKKCFAAYHYTMKTGQDPLQRWGNYGPATRKALVTIEEYLQSPTIARQVANAIDREYKLRRSSQLRESPFETYRCKLCNDKFRRKRGSNQSKEYCDRCAKRSITDRVNASEMFAGEDSTQAKLTWERVNEIRSLYATGSYSSAVLGEKFGVSSTDILHIVHYRTWKPEYDLHHPGQKTPENNESRIVESIRKLRSASLSGEKGPSAKLTWEQVDEIRYLRANEHLSYLQLAEKYGISKANVALIITNQNWKPEHDPRRKNGESI